MNIKINKEFIKELKKELRNKNNDYCGTYIRIDVENNLIMFSFDRYNNNKYSTEKETKIVLQDNIEIKNAMFRVSACSKQQSFLLLVGHSSQQTYLNGGHYTLYKVFFL